MRSDKDLTAPRTRITSCVEQPTLQGWEPGISYSRPNARLPCLMCPSLLLVLPTTHISLLATVAIAEGLRMR